MLYSAFQIRLSRPKLSRIKHYYPSYDSDEHNVVSSAPLCELINDCVNKCLATASVPTHTLVKSVHLHITWKKYMQ